VKSVIFNGVYVYSVTYAILYRLFLACLYYIPFKLFKKRPFSSTRANFF